MNLYTIVGSGTGTAEATALSARLAAWHDAMVAHERKIRAGRPDALLCDDECPHAEARALWRQAVEVFGERAHELTFLRSRAMRESEQSGKLVRPTDALSEAADNGHGRMGQGKDQLCGDRNCAPSGPEDPAQRRSCSDVLRKSLGSDAAHVHEQVDALLDSEDAPTRWEPHRDSLSC